MKIINLLFYINLVSYIKIGISVIITEINNDSLKSKYTNENYLKVYKVPISLMSFYSDGIKLYNHELEMAFDDDYFTFWTTSEKKTNIIITFSKAITIDKILYQAPFENGIEGFGYPTQLKIYIKLRNIDGTLSDNDSDFLLIEDIISEKTGNMVLFQFEEEITLDQMKLEWAGLEESEERIYPAARLIYFLFQENSYINNLLYFFIENDYTYTSIKPELNDFNVIDELEGKIEEYDILKENYESIKEIIERIKKIINKEKLNMIQEESLQRIQRLKQILFINMVMWHITLKIL